MVAERAYFIHLAEEMAEKYIEREEQRKRIEEVENGA